MQLQEPIGSDDHGPAIRGVRGPRSRKLVQDPREGGRRNPGSGVVEDVGVVAGHGISHARPGGGGHVPAQADIPGPKLLGQAQPAAAVNREELVKVDTYFQRRRPVEDEPEPIEDPARVPELGEELQRNLAMAGGEGDVEVRGLGHVPVGRKLHGENSDRCVRREVWPLRECAKK